MPCGDYLIFYRVADQVEIIRMGHASRDWDGVFDSMDQT
jgi:Plasmid stabilisation system protein.